MECGQCFFGGGVVEAGDGFWFRVADLSGEGVPGSFEVADVLGHDGSDLKRRHQRFAHRPQQQSQPPKPHPISGNATAEEVALKLRRNVAKPAKRKETNDH